MLAYVRENKSKATEGSWKSSYERQGILVLTLRRSVRISAQRKLFFLETVIIHFKGPSPKIHHFYLNIYNLKISRLIESNLGPARGQTLT